MEEEKETKDLLGQVLEQVESSIKEISESGLTSENVDSLYKLVDIHKDLKNEEYWKIKEEMKYMRYGTYGYGEDSYGRRSRDSRGRYTESSYGRRGVPNSGRERYRGEDMMDEMYGAYRNYNESKEEYNRSGNYGAKEDSKRGLEDMMMSITDCVCMIFEEVEPEEQEIIRKHIRKMSEL